MNVAAVIAWVALAQWMIFAILSLVSRRPQARNLGISTAVFVVTWVVVFALALPSKTSQGATTAASASASGAGMACVVVDKGMTADAVLAKAGKPDEKRSDEDARGPGAAIWIYRDARCLVHMYGDKVEFVE